MYRYWYQFLRCWNVKVVCVCTATTTAMQLNFPSKRQNKVGSFLLTGQIPTHMQMISVHFLTQSVKQPRCVVVKQVSAESLQVKLEGREKWTFSACFSDWTSRNSNTSTTQTQLKSLTVFGFLFSRACAAHTMEKASAPPGSAANLPPPYPGPQPPIGTYQAQPQIHLGKNPLWICCPSA